jgi:hypothetical protein
MSQKPNVPGFYEWDENDEAAFREAAAASRFRREFTLERPDSKSQAKRGVVRGKKGAADRMGLKPVR